MDKELVLKLLNFCDQFYHNSSYIQTMNAYITDNVTDFQAGIILNNELKHLYLIFKGSNSLTDWSYDLDTTKICLDKNIYVHEGFFNQLHQNGNYNKLLHEINKFPDYKLFITGHSLGGALATLFGYQYSKTIEKEIKIVTFGSPKVGCKEWQKAFNKCDRISYLRFVNKNDPVPNSPFLNYYHVGTKCELNNNSSFISYFNGKQHKCEKYKKGIEKITTWEYNIQ